LSEEAHELEASLSQKKKERKKENERTKTAYGWISFLKLKNKTKQYIVYENMWLTISKKARER
jgi:hypothetical protein